MTTGTAVNLSDAYDWIACFAAVRLIAKMSCRPTRPKIHRLPVAMLGVVAIIGGGGGGCQKPAAKNSAAPAGAVTEPQWRHIRTDEGSATYMTPAVQTVGQYKRFWLAEVFAKPKRATVRGETGTAATRTDLIEVDCAETRVRALQSTFMDEKGWSATDTPDKPAWFFVNPDVQNMVTVRHACAGEKLTGTGYPTMKAARVAYRASLSASKATAENAVSPKGSPPSHP